MPHFKKLHMTTITTRKHILKFYVLIGFAFLFFGALGTLMAKLFLDKLFGGSFETKDYFLLIISAAIYFMAFYTVYRYSKGSPIIVVDSQNITFGDYETFQLIDIEEIHLTGKMPFRYIIRFPMEGAMILFKDGTIKYIYDDLYSNSWELKSFLEQVVINKKSYVELNSAKINPDDLSFELGVEFKGNQFTSLRGLTLWGLIGFFFFMIIRTKNPAIGGIIFFLVFGSFWFTLNSWLMHYFVLANDYFVVKNHNFIWLKKYYRLKDIKEIVFETQGKQPNCLRVITNDFRNKLYPAGTLRDKNWLELKEELEKKGISVRNECIF